MAEQINVAFVGNPNCGKTTLFNAYTGARLKVANWPGVTVEKKEGSLRYHDHPYKLVDLPGIYSLTCYTMEEKLSRQYIMEDEVDVIVNVVDASALERNLYLTLQLIELGKPIVVALNMMDIVEERGMEIDLHRLQEMLGVPVIPVCARKKTGLDILMHGVAHHKDQPIGPLEHRHHEGSHIHDHHKEHTVVYSDDVEDGIDEIQRLLIQRYTDLDQIRWLAIKVLENDPEILSKYPLEIRFLSGKSYESIIISQKYDFIEEVIGETLVHKSQKSELTDQIDRILTHRIWGMPVFLLIMALVFLLTFTVGDWLKGYFEIGLGWLSERVEGLLQAIGAGKGITSLVIGGILSGVGGILTFLPNIMILFLALAVLEDSGYMSRVAYVMDGVMGRIGLSGRAFIPMLLGFGCTVPAVMASRALEDPRDRLKTILVTPFMSCSARLPIYVLFSQAFFGRSAMLAAYSMYVIGLAVAIAVARIMSRAGRSKTENSLLIELPEYKMPNTRTIVLYVWEKVKDYLTRAGTTIFIASIVLWFLLNFGPKGMVGNMADSFAAVVGQWLSPVMTPAGLGVWQVVVSLISGLAAKEVVVSSMGVLYGIGNIASQGGMDALSSHLGAAGFTSVNAYALMIFCLLYIPCIATVATIRRETNSLKWTLASVGMHLTVAWVSATLFFQLASRLAGV